MKLKRQARHCLAALACALTLAACGGGGGGGSGDVQQATTPPPAPDARNGDYAMYAADARAYTLSLDFDAKTYRVVGNGQDFTGSLRAANNSGKFDLDPAGTSAAAPNAPRFTWFNDTVVGALRLPAGTTPFVAARSFVTSLAEAAGTYNFLASVQDTAAPSDNYIFAGELQAGGALRTCMDTTIYKIALCPTVATATVTVNGSEFRADTGSGIYPFRIAKVGSDRVFLRASPSTGTSRRLQVGLPEGAFTDGTFEGANTLGYATIDWFAGAPFNANWTEASANYVEVGTVNTLGVNGPAGLVGINMAGEGNFFAMHGSDLLVLMAANGNPTRPGYVEFGKKQ